MKAVKAIPSELASPFIMNIHYAHRTPCIMYAFGLFVNGDLVGVCTYGMPASPYLCMGVAGKENKGKVIELNRLCFLPGKNGENNASMLVGRSLKMLPKNLFVVSYADTGKGHVGYIYQATNWIYTGMTKQRTDMYSDSGHSRHNCENRKMRQNRTAKHRYIYLTGNKKKQLAQLKYSISPYPKGDTQRYEVKQQSTDVVGSQTTMLEALEI